MSVDFESNIEEEIAELRREIAAKGTSSKQGGRNMNACVDSQEYSAFCL